MKLAVISPSQVPSGTANSIQAMKVAQALAQVGHDTHLWLPGARTAAWPALAEQYGLLTPFEMTWLPSTKWLRRYDFAFNAARQAQAWGAQAIYTWLPQAALLGLWRGLPILLEAHDRPTGNVGPRLWRTIARHPGSKRLLFITQALRRVMAAEFGVRVSDQEAVIAPDGVDLERYTALPGPEEARAQLGLAGGLTAMYTGHLYAGRGMEILLHLAQAHPGINFLWVGGRPVDVETWRQKATALGLGNLHLTGFVPNARIPLYQAAGEVLLMPYERSVAVSGGGNTADICSPMKLFEYMAAGRAILSSDLPVLREVLNESNSVMVAPEDLAGWSAALGRLAQDAALRGQLGAQARADVGPYSWQERAQRSLRGLVSAP